MALGYRSVKPAAALRTVQPGKCLAALATKTGETHAPVRDGATAIWCSVDPHRDGSREGLNKAVFTENG